MNIKIDYDLCTRCGLCIKVCGSKRIGEGDDGRPYKIIEAGCSDCGHCIAVCPVDAIVNTRVDMSEYRRIVAPGITTDQFTNLVRNRRSAQDRAERLSSGLRLRQRPATVPSYDRPVAAHARNPPVSSPDLVRGEPRRPRWQDGADG